LHAALPSQALEESERSKKALRREVEQVGGGEVGIGTLLWRRRGRKSFRCARDGGAGGGGGGRACVDQKRKA
jgi:hypothetical protein